MIDETVLERLLHGEAETYDVPPHGPADVLAAATEDEQRRPERLKWAGFVAAAASVVVAAALVGPRLTTSRMESGGGGQVGGGVTTVADNANKQLAEEDRQAPGSTDGAYVVRTGDTWLEVPKGRVRDVLRDVARVAGTHGGYVSESDAGLSGERPSGSVTIRVPVAAFDRAVEEVGRLGDVREQSVRGEDVSERVTDTAARLRSATATRAQLRALLAKATTVTDVLAVQERLAQVQTEIEKLTATRDSLRDRTSYGTLRVHVSPPGSPDERGGFANAWDDAVDGFVGGFQGLVAVSGTLAFALVVGLAGFFLARRAYRLWVRGVV